MRGKILLIGGNVDKGTVTDPGKPASETFLHFFEEGILRRMLTELDEKQPRIEIITSASLIPREVGKEYKEAFHKLGVYNVGVLSPRSKREADEPEVLRSIKNSAAVMFCGGDQCRLVEILSGSKLLDIIKTRLSEEEDFLVSGTSAGAMAFAKEMIAGGKNPERIVKGGVEWGKGFGLTHKLIIDTHFINRKRFGRLIEAVATFPDLIGLGLGEDTAVLCKNGIELETIGSGLVVIMDATETKENSFRYIPAGENLCLEKVILHILPKGRTYNLQERHFVRTTAGH